VDIHAISLADTALRLSAKPILSMASTSEVMAKDNGSIVCMFLICVLLATFPEEFGYNLDYVRMMNESMKIVSPPIVRERKAVSEIFRELGPSYVRRVYRMKEDAFWLLHKMLYAYIALEADSLQTLATITL
jgi:hypothetical protein